MKAYELFTYNDFNSDSCYYFSLISDHYQGTYEILHHATTYHQTHQTCVVDAKTLSYLRKQFDWLHAYWRGHATRRGLPAQDNAILNAKNASILNEIVIGWLEIFKNAPDQFRLINMYPTDLMKKPDNSPLLERTQVLNQLTGLNNLLTTAKSNNLEVLYEFLSN